MEGQGRPILGANSSAEASKRMDPPKKHTFTAASVNAKIFVPRSFQPANNAYQGQQGQTTNLTPYQDPVTQIKQAIFALTSNPASFESNIVPLTGSLSVSVTTEESLLNVINELLNQSIAEANFRYTGARMCNHFCHNLTNAFPHGNFRQHLLKRCREEFESLSASSEDVSVHPRLRGFTFVMAELLTNLKTASNEKFTILADPVMDLLLLMMTRPTDDNMRCVVQVYKLSNNKLNLKDPKVDSLFSHIKKVLLDDNTKSNLRAMLMSIVELRASSFDQSGQADKSPSPPSSAAVHPNLVGDGEVFYDEHGQPVMMLPDDLYAEGDYESGVYYSEETYGPQQPYNNGDEQQYCRQDYQGQQGQQGQQWSSGDQDYLYASSQENYDDYMDDDIANDYDKFLRDNNLL